MVSEDRFHSVSTILYFKKGVLFSHYYRNNDVSVLSVWLVNWFDQIVINLVLLERYLKAQYSALVLRLGDTRSFFRVGTMQHAPSHQPETFSRVATPFFCSIVPGTKSACLLGISLTFCPMKQKLKPWDTHFFSCVGGMEHVALHQREKNFSCPHSLNKIKRLVYQNTNMTKFRI